MRPKPRPFLFRRVRLAPALRRHPRVWWGFAATAAIGAGALTASMVAAAEDARESWGPGQPVLVAVADVDAGDEITPDLVELDHRPAGTVPSSALRTLPDGAVAAAGIVAGEVVVGSRLTGGNLSAVAARIPAGRRAVAIPNEPGVTPPLSPGDRVDVIAVVPSADDGGGRPPGFALTTGALVVEITDAAITVAVPRDVVPRVSVALGAGVVTLALVGR